MWASARRPYSTTAISGYLAFTAATMLAVIASGRPATQSSTIVALLAISLPALAAWLYIDAVEWVGPEVSSRIVRQAVVLVALAFSVAGVLSAIWSFSRLAVFVILLEASVLYLAISGLSFLRDEPDSQR
jgi:hypothetical protein